MQKIVKNTLYIISGVLFGILVTANVMNAASEQENPLKLVEQTAYRTIRCYTLKDYDTNCQYIIVTDIKTGGVAITERKSANGLNYGSEKIDIN